MIYEYKMIQIPPDISVNARDSTGSDAAHYLQNIVKQHATNGWEFYRVDPIGVQVKPGCLASILGAKTVEKVYYVVSFRRSS